jgi:protein-tyrosine phosphatase
MPLKLHKSLAAVLLCAALLPFSVRAEGPARPLAGLAAGMRPIPVADGGQATQVDLDRRVVALEGQSNFRDLGGYQTADGRHVKWGKIFRSGELSRLTPADYGQLKPLGIRTIYDLRDQDERTSQRTVWAAGPVRALHSAKLETGQGTLSMLADPDLDAAKARAVLKSFYTGAPLNYAPEYRAIFHELLQGHAPLLLHCTAGKDRTGVGSALILTALGVPRAAVIQDFTLTNRLLKPSRLPAGAFMKIMERMPLDAREAMTRADPAYIEATFDAIDAQYGSVDNYLSAELGVGPLQKARLRTLYLE